MNIFHVIIDTSILRREPLGSPGFNRLLSRIQQGVIRVYIPHVVVEERRTQLLADYCKCADNARKAVAEAKRSHFAMLIKGLPTPECAFPNREEVDKSSRSVFQQYFDENRIEILDFTFDHAARTLEKYMLGVPPFKSDVSRTDERKQIPDSWILEAALEIKERPGRHCILVDDARFQSALRDEGFEIYTDIEALDSEIESATAVVPIRGEAPVEPIAQQPEPLYNLRGENFRNIDIIVLGMNEALGNPEKEKLFSTLEGLGVDRKIAEHEARTLLLSGALNDTGSHLLPINAELAGRAAAEQVVRDLLMRMI